MFCSQKKPARGCMHRTCASLQRMRWCDSTFYVKNHAHTFQTQVKMKKRNRLKNHTHTHTNKQTHTHAHIWHTVIHHISRHNCKILVVKKWQLYIEITVKCRLHSNIITRKRFFSSYEDLRPSEAALPGTKAQAYFFFSRTRVCEYVCIHSHTHIV